MFKRSLLRLSSLRSLCSQKPTLIAGFFLASGALFCSNLKAVQAQDLAPFSAEALAHATEPQFKQLWVQLQMDCAELEATEPASAISRYQQFFEQGAYRNAFVSVQISLRIARIWEMELHDYDKAIEIYDWALAKYKNQTDTVLLEKGRLAALKALQKAAVREGQFPPVLQKDPNKAANPQMNQQSAKEPAKPGGGLIVRLPATEGGGSLGVSVPGVNKAPSLGVDLGSSNPAAGGGLSIGSMVTGVDAAANPFAVSHTSPPGVALGWRPGTESCVTALARQKNGLIWVATEDSGVWSCNPAAPSSSRWQQFNTGNGLEDNSGYALAVDNKERVWVGTLNHGVSVWNGHEWKTYGMLDGPLGERVFDIAVSPKDGDVWIATNAGLTRYSQAKDTWSYTTRLEGLPSDQIQSLAFDKAGNIIVGTQCDGLAFAPVATNFKEWRQVKGPTKMPVSRSGSGLPSNLINDVIVARDGAIYVGTPNGLAWSRDNGLSFSYLRGKDYGAKVKGQYGGAPANWKSESGEVLFEDYISCLAEDAQGKIWVGHWQSGNEVLEMSAQGKGSIKRIAGREESGFVKAILPISSLPVSSLPTVSANPAQTVVAKPSTLLARYDEGLSESLLEFGSPRDAASTLAPTAASIAVPPSSPKADKPASLTIDIFKTKEASPKEATGASQTSQYPALPSPAKAPSKLELDNITRKVAALKGQLLPGQSAFEGDDWRTWGDWTGRYGSRYAVLCAAHSPLNQYVSNDLHYFVHAMTGPNGRGDESLRNWVHWLKSDLGKVLYNPVVGYRREAEWDDHGETYPTTVEGPDVWVKVTVPAGTHRMSLYFFNKDGHLNDNRRRDYVIDIKQGNAKSVELASALPSATTARVRDFHGGVYKRFLLAGPGHFWVKVAKNNSFNTIVNGLFIDKLSGPDTGHDNRRDVWLGEVRYDKPNFPKLTKGEPTYYSAAGLNWNLDWAWDKPGVEQWQHNRLLAYRGANAVFQTAVQAGHSQTLPEAERLLYRWRWQLPMWTDTDRTEFRAKMALGRKSMLDLNPAVKAALHETSY